MARPLGSAAARMLVAKTASALLVVVLAMSIASAEQIDANSIHGVISLTSRDGIKLADHANVVVFIEGIKGTARRAKRQELPTMSHAGMRFTPRVMVVSAGQEVDFLNDDQIFHNVFSLSKTKTFDLGIYPEGSSKYLKFDNPGLVKIYCNMHPNMIGNILVLNNDFYAVTDALGRFEISGIPDGEYTLRVWHEFSAEKSQLIELKNGLKFNYDATLAETKLPRQHNNKFGKAYQKKY